jgi:hypothetical protein
MSVGTVGLFVKENWPKILLKAGTIRKPEMKKTKTKSKETPNGTR